MDRVLVLELPNGVIQQCHLLEAEGKGNFRSMTLS
jgi:hypothetical protein